MHHCKHRFVIWQKNKNKMVDRNFHKCSKMLFELFFQKLTIMLNCAFLFKNQVSCPSSKMEQLEGQMLKFKMSCNTNVDRTSRETCFILKIEGENLGKYFFLKFCLRFIFRHK